MKVKRIEVVISLLLFMFISHISAQQLTGREIMNKNDEQLSSQSEEVELLMELVNKKGRKRTRKIKQYQVTGEDKNNKTLIRFLSPADVKGTGFLSLEQTDRDDDQWLYLPALHRSRRISASNKTDNFMGSDFTYEDLSTEDLDDFNYKNIGESAVDGVSCYIVEAVANNDDKRKETAYAKRVLYVAKESFIIKKIEFFNKRNVNSKIFVADEIKRLNGEIWRAHKMTMNNLETGHSTVLLFENYVVNEGLDEATFTQRYLESDK